MEHGIKLTTVNISAPDVAVLAHFYERLLGWQVVAEEPGWAMLAGPESVRLSFEEDKHYAPPVWPSAPGQPPQQVHLEVRVDDLSGALEHALACGARLADYQPQEDVQVCLDPAGHPFCLWLTE
jgi:catechol 2,3-dioxygenase-like lactoylglutathione lyase family enzyme